MAGLLRRLKDDGSLVVKNARGASWTKPNWPIPPTANSSRPSTATGPRSRSAISDKIKAKAQAKGVEIWRPDVLAGATRDSIRALMLIRAYRVRGHLHANLDPLGI